MHNERKEEEEKEAVELPHHRPVNTIELDVDEVPQLAMILDFVTVSIVDKFNETIESVRGHLFVAFRSGMQLASLGCIIVCLFKDFSQYGVEDRRLHVNVEELNSAVFVIFDFFVESGDDVDAGRSLFNLLHNEALLEACFLSDPKHFGVGLNHAWQSLVGPRREEDLAPKCCSISIVRNIIRCVEI